MMPATYATESKTQFWTRDKLYEAIERVAKQRDFAEFRRLPMARDAAQKELNRLGEILQGMK